MRGRWKQHLHFSLLLLLPECPEESALKRARPSEHRLPFPSERQLHEAVPSESQKLSSVLPTVPIRTLGNCDFARQPGMHLSLQHAPHIYVHGCIRAKFLCRLASNYCPPMALISCLPGSQTLAEQNDSPSPPYKYLVYISVSPWMHIFLLQTLLSLNISERLLYTRQTNGIGNPALWQLQWTVECT